MCSDLQQYIKGYSVKTVSLLPCKKKKKKGKSGINYKENEPNLNNRS